MEERFPSSTTKATHNSRMVRFIHWDKHPKLNPLSATTRFSLFQVLSAYTNAGMSLVDQSMVPFQRAYPMIFAMIFLILAGNTAFVSIAKLC